MFGNQVSLSVDIYNLQLLQLQLQWGEYVLLIHTNSIIDKQSSMNAVDERLEGSSISNFSHESILTAIPKLWVNLNLCACTSNAQQV